MTMARGFTLIEMLVVLLIMGLMVGMVTVAAQPDDKARLRVETDRLSQLLTLAANEARLTGKAMAWTADGPAYRFWQFSEEFGWLGMVDDQTLRARTLPHGMTISNLLVDNVRMSKQLRVEFNPNGSTSSFTMEMSLGAAHSTMAASPLGDVRVLAAGAPPG